MRDEPDTAMSTSFDARPPRYDRSVSERLSIAVVGPTFPYSGGVSSHTTTLAHRLIEAGYDVDMVSWKAQYPKFLRDSRLPDDEPEVARVPGARYPLAWYNPIGWWRVGRRLRNADVVAVTAITPYHAVPYLVMRAAMGRHPRGIVIAHNVLPHERGSRDELLVRRLYRSFGRVLTHSSDQAALAREVAASPAVDVADARMPLPDFLFGDEPAPAAPRAATEPVRLVFFGMVREYKGVDLLIDAVAEVPNVHLTIAGEFWQPVEQYREQVERLGLGDRVTIVPGYVRLTDLPALLGDADALVLPYRHGSATFNADLGFRFGLPVVASDAGTLARDVRDGIDGLIVPAGDVPALRDALSKLSDKAELAKLAAGVDRGASDAQWRRYVADFVRLAGH